MTKSKFRNFTAWLLTLAMLIALLPSAAMAFEPGDMNLSVVPGDGTITLTWDEIDAKGVTYTVFSFDLDGENYTEYEGTPDYDDGKYTYTIEGLENDKTYSVGVDATCKSFTYGSMSAGADATPYAEGATVPGAPVITEIITENNTITVSWNAPENDGGAKLLGYEIECWPEGSTDGNGGMSIGLEADVTSYTIDELPDNSINYDIKICAMNSVGWGEYGAYPNAEKKEFADVHPVNHWAAESVDYVYENGLMNGTDEDLFSPDAQLTRAMLVTVLYRLEGEPTVSGITSFGDLEEGQYYLDAVCWAQINGIANGISDTEFAPDSNITREQIAAIMFRYAEYKNAAPEGAWAIRLDYSDLADISDYASEGIMYCTLKGIMQGRGENRFAPKDNATRAEIAVILHRFIEENN